MMSDDKRKKMALIIAMGKPEGKDDPDAEKETSEESDGLDSAAQDILDAVESKDAKALKDALKDFMYMCEEE